MDVLTDMIQGMRLTGGVFLEAEFTAPWSVAAKVGPEDCVPFVPEPGHVIAYHYVVSGKCLLQVAGQPPVSLEGGDIVILARNDAHVLASRTGLRPVDANRLIQPAPDGGLARIVHGGGGEETRILCGFLSSAFPHNAVLSLLPVSLRYRVTEAAMASWIESSFRFAAAQLGTGRSGSPVMMAKLAELLFVEAVRCYAAEQSEDPIAWIGTMTDPAIGRALGLIHGDLARRWTIDELAREAAISRSVFAERFTRIVGEPPMRYLTRQRLARAAARLRETRAPISSIAYDLCYESEAAFNRAFRREFGLPPATWRRQKTGAGEVLAGSDK